MSPIEEILGPEIRIAANASTLVIGPTGGGKTRQIACAAEYIHDGYGKVLRLYSSDGGGWPGKVEQLIRFGIVEVFRMRTRGPDVAMETLTRSSLGYWPAQIKKLSGEVPINVPMLPPVVVRYRAICPKCSNPVDKPSTGAFGAQLTCPTCKQPTPIAAVSISKVVTQHPAFAHVGGVAFDGITSMGNYGMEDIATRQGKGELQGEKTALGGVIRSGEIVLGSTNRAQVGFMQVRQQEWVNNANSIPNLVIPPIFTALTLETSDEGGLQVVGPRLEGIAKTDQAGAWFGNTIEARTVKDDHDHDVYELRLSRFKDDQGRWHLLRNRAEPGALPVLLADPPLLQDDAGNITNGEVACTNANLGLFFQLLDRALTSGVAQGREKFGALKVTDDQVTNWATEDDGRPPVGMPPSLPLAIGGSGTPPPLPAGIPAAVAPKPVGPAAAAPAPPVPVAGLKLAPKTAAKPKKAQAPVPAATQEAAKQAEKPIAEQLVEAAADLGVFPAEAPAPAAPAAEAPIPVSKPPALPLAVPKPPVAKPPAVAPPSPPPSSAAPPTAPPSAAAAPKPGAPKAWAPPVARRPPAPPTAGTS